MTSWRRYHDDPARIASRPPVDRRLVSRTRWVEAITSDAGPADPLARLVLLAMAAVMPRGAPGQTGARMTHVELVGRTRLSERTVRDRIAWCAHHGWIRIDGPHTRRVYVATTPSDVRRHMPDRTLPMRHHLPDRGHAMRHDMPDTSADILPLRRRRRCASCGQPMPRSTPAHHTVCPTCWDV